MSNNLIVPSSDDVMNVLGSPGVTWIYQNIETLAGHETEITNKG